MKTASRAVLAPTHPKAIAGIMMLIMIALGAPQLRADDTTLTPTVVRTPVGQLIGTDCPTLAIDAMAAEAGQSLAQEQLGSSALQRRELRAHLLIRRERQCECRHERARAQYCRPKR